MRAAHHDDAYGNKVLTETSATTSTYQGIADEMDRYEPERWRETAAAREDVRSLNLSDAAGPQTLLSPKSLHPEYSTREVAFTFWVGRTRAAMVLSGFPKNASCAPGNAAIDGRHKATWDANIENWPREIAQALAFQPLHVLPGHGNAGGPRDILTGQRAFLQDLYSTVKMQVEHGESLQRDSLPSFPERDRNSIPGRRFWTPTSPLLTRRSPSISPPHYFHEMEI